MKRIKTDLRTEQKTSSRQKCKHREAFVVAYCQDQERDEAILILDCPECGACLCIIGSLVEHIGD